MGDVGEKSQKPTLSSQNLPRLELRSLSFAFQGSLESLVQGGFGFFVLLLTDAALFVFDFQFEEFLFQAFKQF